ncbi:MAG TPA: type II toxin-antitoxin system VapC family toxin [Bryobacteraceae bacterium]|jgi:ribonuclease VapC|nr:type II toxin-antitoxin system VapC family toxin [Bryobacteraceae bacterium]
MVIDSSAILAIVFQEPEADQFTEQIATARKRRMSAVNWLETQMVVESRYGRESADKVEIVLDQLGVELVGFDRQHAWEAQSAWRRFGKGRHRAGLNLGDCAAYATAVISGEPLLAKGDDFQHTDIARVES